MAENNEQSLDETFLNSHYLTLDETALSVNNPFRSLANSDSSSTAYRRIGASESQANVGIPPLTTHSQHRPSAPPTENLHIHHSGQFQPHFAHLGETSQRCRQQPQNHTYSGREEIRNPERSTWHSLAPPVNPDRVYSSGPQFPQPNVDNRFSSYPAQSGLDQNCRFFQEPGDFQNQRFPNQQIPAFGQPHQQYEYYQQQNSQAQAFLEAVKVLVDRLSRTEPKTVFSGLDTEEPRAFIMRMEQYFLKANIPADEQVEIAASRLQGAAKGWYEPYRSVRLQWPMFTDNLIRAFDNQAKLSQLTTQLYGQKQEAKENVEVFISRKRCLFQRLSLNLSESVLIGLLIEQLRPELRSRLRGITFRSVEELTELARAIERDLHVLPSSYRNQNVGNPNINDRLEQRPPSRCRYCGGWHFHRDCPQNRFSQRRENYDRPMRHHINEASGTSQPQHQGAIRRQQATNQGNERRDGPQPAPRRS